MDPDYDIEHAQSCVEAAASAYKICEDSTIKSIAAMNSTHPQSKPNVQTTKYQVMHVDQPPSWRLIHANGNETEEIFNIYGILCASDLPPVQTRNIANLKSKALCLHQAVGLIAFDSTKFHEAMKNIENVHDTLSSHMNNTKIQWESATYEGHKALDVNARYFTARKTIPQERGQPFEHGVDPNSILASIRGQELIHGDDNKVKYISKYQDRNGKYRQTRIDPAQFHIGDIIQATVSFIVFPTRDHGAKMTLLLKVLTLIEAIQSKDIHKQIKKSAVIKRKVIFEDDRELRDGVTKMTLNEDNNRQQ